MRAPHELVIMAELHRHDVTQPRKRTHRYYALAENAVKAVSLWAVTDGHVGDVIEVTHRYTGLQIGTIKVTARGRLDSQWIWEDKE